MKTKNSLKFAAAILLLGHSILRGTLTGPSSPPRPITPSPVCGDPYEECFAQCDFEDQLFWQTWQVSDCLDGSRNFSEKPWCCYNPMQ